MYKLIILICLLPYFVCSQNYSAVNSQKESRFSYNNNGDIGIAVISIDSVVADANDTIYFNYRIVENPTINPGCIDSISRNFFADRIVIRQNGSSIFFNSNNDSVHLFTNAGLNTAWHLFELGSGSYLEAKVSSINYLQVLGINDSVKQITIQAKDVVNNNIPHPFNGKQILIGKNSGLIRFYNTLQFPNDTTSYNLVGRSNPELGIANLTEEMIFDFNPGDVFQYTGSYNAAPTSAMYDHEEIIIISKYSSANNDTIVYQKDHRYYQKMYQFMPFDSTITYTHDTIQDTIVLSNGHLLNTLPFKYINQGIGNTGYVTQSIYSSYNLRSTKSFDASYTISPNDSCLEYTIGWCIYGIYTYAEGLGFVSRRESGNNCYNNNMIYYSKGTETYGTSLNWNLILSVDENKSADNKLIIYPNPSQTIITIGNHEGKDYSYKITDLNGRIISSGNYDNSINISDLAIGFYLLSIKNATEEYRFKFIKE